MKNDLVIESYQAVQLWNAMADRKNLSIHHGIKVITGWNQVPIIGKKYKEDSLESQISSYYYEKNMNETQKAVNFLKAFIGALEKKIDDYGEMFLEEKDKELKEMGLKGHLINMRRSTDKEKLKEMGV